ncbi:DUF2269 family protein [Terasakiella pusilla]|uniref:DUF2269 family protein n=1 Tax=Terasakiella pusilla TaxID=64973 RepID=UPI003AA8A2E5
MIDPLIVKTLHIFGAMVIFGTGMGTAFHGLMCNLNGDLRSMVTGNRNVVIADWIFTTPAVILQPITGFYLMWANGWSLDDHWIVASITLYIIAGGCWLPVVWLQVRMHRMSEMALETNSELPSIYKRYFRIWFLLGWPAFISGGAILWLMVSKPF